MSCFWMTWSVNENFWLKLKRFYDHNEWKEPVDLQPKNVSDAFWIVDRTSQIVCLSVYSFQFFVKIISKFFFFFFSVHVNNYLLPKDFELTQQTDNVNISQRDKKLDYNGPKW